MNPPAITASATIGRRKIARSRVHSVGGSFWGSVDVVVSWGFIARLGASAGGRRRFGGSPRRRAHVGNLFGRSVLADVFDRDTGLLANLRLHRSVLHRFE